MIAARTEPEVRSRLARAGLCAALCAALACGAGSCAREQSEAPDPVARGACAKPSSDHASESVWITGGTFTLGEGGLYPEEAPPRKTEVASFWIDRYEVTNSQFARFVYQTHYVTSAERRPDPRDFPNISPAALVPGSVVFVPPTELTRGGDITQWWQFIAGADWRHPSGPNSSIAERDAYPVVHVSDDDAAAYAHWAGRELPSEAQWEYAARGGQRSAASQSTSKRAPIAANTWQGFFPLSNLLADGYRGAAPVGCFAANGYGLHDMIGNVWEWTSDWYFPSHSDADTPRAQDSSREPRGFDPHQPGVPVRVIKGGSYLCAPNYCMRYRPEARQAQGSALGTDHIGFRTVEPRPPQNSQIVH